MDGVRAALMAHDLDARLYYERHQTPRARVPREASWWAPAAHIPRAVRAWLATLVAVRGPVGAAGAGLAARQDARPRRR